MSNIRTNWPVECGCMYDVNYCMDTNRSRVVVAMERCSSSILFEQNFRKWISGMFIILLR